MSPRAAEPTRDSQPAAVPEPQRRRLLALRHHDPHSILGVHPGPNGVVVRAYRPGADRIALLVDGERPKPMTNEGDGLFDVLVDGHRAVFDYQLEVRYPHGATFTVRDPYRFPPTLGELAQHLWNEGSHRRPYDRLGAHPMELERVKGVAFAVWAPDAAGVSVVGDFNNWDGRLHMMRVLGSSGIWELFLPDVKPGDRYKFEIRTRDGRVMLKTDPFAFEMEMPPQSASVVFESGYRFGDHEWMQARASINQYRTPISIYEVHLGSWRRVAEQNNRSLTYRESAEALADYVSDLGFTHVEFMPVMEHPFLGSWGYQVTGYFAPSRRYGNPDEFRYLVDYLHRRGIGVILDWVPAHFPQDYFSLGRFDGTALYEHLDSRLGEHPEWGTFIFNFGRNEVRNFLIASADFWLNSFHADGLRVDAVSSMLYLDYARRAGQWVPNIHGGNQNLEAISFLRKLNEEIHARHAGVLMIAEESTAWGGVSRPVYLGGLGFGFKWDMGWMHDTLEYFQKDPIHRRYHHNNLTFGLIYAWTENFMLPLSHDEAVHGKGALLSKMSGDRWQQFANLRAMYAYMWARPGKKILFMGGEIGQWREWNHDRSLDWNLLDYDSHRGIRSLVRDLNRIYRTEPALHEADCEPAGFQWVDANDSDDSAISFLRIAPSSGRKILCVGNFSPVVRHGFRVGAPARGVYREILNTDSGIYGGSNVGNAGGLHTDDVAWHGQPYSLMLTLPPLAVIYFAAPE